MASSLLKNRLQNVEATNLKIQEEVAQEAIKPSEAEADIIKRIARQMSIQFKNEISVHGLTEAVKDKIRTAIAEEAKNVTGDYALQQHITRMACANVIGLGPIEPYMDDPEVTEIIVQRYDNICVERAGVMYRVDAMFTDEAHLQQVINRIVQPVGRQINVASPIVDARLTNGSRVNATIPPVTPDGATLSIRKFSDKAMTGEDYVRLGSISEPMVKFLAQCVQGKISMIVSGGTSTGKTTLLNMLSSFIPENELIITIEDSCELQLHQPNVRRMEARPTVGEGMMAINTQTLVKNSLRMRPDRIIVGEIRDGTIVDMMSAMSTGHEGSMSTVHANNPGNLMNSRIPILYAMHDNVKFSAEAQAIQIVEALQLVVQISRLRNGKRKITQITHISGLTEKGRVKLNDIFKYDEANDRFIATGYIPEDIIQRLQNRGIIVDRALFDEGGCE